MMNLKFLVIIPARGGSKGIKNKNIIDLGGKPLLEYTITPAKLLLAAGIVDKVIVSTDSQPIARLAQELGVEVPFLRPPQLATDTARSVDLILHALEHFQKEGIFFDSVITLQPTSPLRNEQDLRLAIELYNRHQADSLITAYQEETINDLIIYKKNADWAVPLNPKHNQGIRRQEHDRLYIRNGAIYITRVKYLQEQQRIISDHPLIYLMPKSRSINLDTEEDLRLLKSLLAL